MKKVFAALLAYLILQTGLFGCAPQPEQPSFPDRDAVTEPDEKNDDVANHALNLALYFREDVTDAEELIDNPHLYECLRSV